MAEIQTARSSVADAISSAHIPIVSIGMPVYNGEKYIREALDSLLAQTFTDFELIISDNASTDATRTICEGYGGRDKRIHYIRQNANLGAAKNFEYVLAHSRGKYFMWAACDDLWAANWLEILIAEFRQDDFALRGSVRFMVNDKIVMESQPQSYKKGQFIRFFMAEEKTTNARNFHIYGLFDRKKLLALNLSISDSDYYPDYLLTFQMVGKGNLRAIPRTFQTFRIHAENSGTAMVQRYKGLPRLIYAVHPIAYYRRYVAIAPPRVRPLIVLLSPLKHIHNQMHLWWRGFRKIVLKSENI